MQLDPIMSDLICKQMLEILSVQVSLVNSFVLFFILVCMVMNLEYIITWSLDGQGPLHSQG